MKLRLHSIYIPYNADQEKALADAVRKRLGEHHRTLAVSAVANAFPSLGEALSESLVDTIHATMVGAVMARNVEPKTADGDKTMLAHLETMVVAHFPAESQADGET